MATSAMGIRINTSYYLQQNQPFDLCEINGSKFALFNKKIQNDKSIFIDLSDYNVVILAPLEAENNISIKAVSVIALSNLNAKRGETKIEASEKLIILGNPIQSYLDNNLSGTKGVYTYGIVKERLEMILEEFAEGISKQHGPTIVDALVDTFDAIEDPSGENESPTIDMVKAFKFFNIPSESENYAKKDFTP